MEASVLIAFNLAILAALISPGPAFLITTKSALSHGRQSGLLTAIGLATAACCWATLALLGLTAILAAMPSLFITLKIAGAVYLAWMAIQLWRGADSPLEAQSNSGLQGFTLGLATNLANPKSVFFITAIFSTVLPPSLNLVENVGIIANLFLLEAGWYGFVAILMTTKPIRQTYIKMKAYFDRFAAGILGFMAARIALP